MEEEYRHLTEPTQTIAPGGLGGASCYPGGLVTFGPGYVAANTIAEDLGIEKWWPVPESVAAARQKGML